MDEIGVEFLRWYDKSKQQALYTGTEEETLWVQCNRSNVSADTPLHYYKVSIGIPFIGILLQQLQNHFSADNCCSVSHLLSLMRSLFVKLGIPLPEQFESWHDDLLTSRSLDNDVSRWFNM